MNQPHREEFWLNARNLEIKPFDNVKQEDNIRVLYTNSLAEAELWATTILEQYKDKEDERIGIGIDIEWKPNKIALVDNNPAAVLQISHIDNILVFHIFGTHNDSEPCIKILPDSALHVLLTSPKFLRVGNRVLEDLRKLNLDGNLHVSSGAECLDLAKLAKMHYYEFLVDCLGRETYERWARFSHIIGLNGWEKLKWIPKIQPIDFVLLGTEQQRVGGMKETLKALISELERVGEDELKQLLIPNKKRKKSSSNVKVVLDDLSPSLPLNAVMLSHFESNTPVEVPVGLRNMKTGLESLASRYLDLRVYKHFTISCSNWEYFPLSLEQIKYAAVDAYVSEAVYRKIRDDLIRLYIATHGTHKGTTLLEEKINLIILESSDFSKFTKN
jgi:hypothetical protein